MPRKGRSVCLISAVPRAPRFHRCWRAAFRLSGLIILRKSCVWPSSDWAHYTVFACAAGMRKHCLSQTPVSIAWFAWACSSISPPIIAVWRKSGGFCAAPGRRGDYLPADADQPKSFLYQSAQHDGHPIGESNEEAGGKTHFRPAGWAALESLSPLANSSAAPQTRLQSGTPRLLGIPAVSSGAGLASRGVPPFLVYGAVLKIARSGMDAVPVYG